MHYIFAYPVHISHSCLFLLISGFLHCQLIFFFCVFFMVMYMFDTLFSLFLFILLYTRALFSIAHSIDISIP